MNKGGHISQSICDSPDVEQIRSAYIETSSGVEKQHMLSLYQWNIKSPNPDPSNPTPSLISLRATLRGLLPEGLPYPNLND